MELYVDIEKKLSGFNLKVKFNGGKDVRGLLGASGSGKSMTLRCIAGIEKPDRGRIVLNDKVLFDSEKGINLSCRHRKVGFLFQNYALFPSMTLEENIEFGLGKLPEGVRREIVKEKVRMMELEGMEKRYPYQLSGGQQQRVALARALAVEPEVLLLDEPFSALDEHLRSTLLKYLMEALEKYRGTTLFVTHNMEEAYRMCGELIVMEKGRVEASGRKEEIFKAPPTIATARLMGYRNFSTVKSLSKDQFEAVDWGIKIKVRGSEGKKINCVGIQSSSIRRATPDDVENVFECWPSAISETPFRNNIFLCMEKKPESINHYQLQWEVSGELLNDLKDTALPWKVCINPDNIVIFEK